MWNVHSDIIPLEVKPSYTRLKVKYYADQILILCYIK